MKSGSELLLWRVGFGDFLFCAVDNDKWRRLVGVDRRLVDKGVAVTDSADPTDPARSLDGDLVRQRGAGARLIRAHNVVAGGVRHGHGSRTLQRCRSAYVQPYGAVADGIQRNRARIADGGTGTGEEQVPRKAC